MGVGIAVALYMIMSGDPEPTPPPKRAMRRSKSKFKQPDPIKPQAKPAAKALETKPAVQKLEPKVQPKKLGPDPKVLPKNHKKPTVLPKRTNVLPKKPPKKNNDLPKKTKLGPWCITEGETPSEFKEGVIVRLSGLSTKGKNYNGQLGTLFKQDPNHRHQWYVTLGNGDEFSAKRPNLKIHDIQVCLPGMIREKAKKPKPQKPKPKSSWWKRAGKGIAKGIGYAAVGVVLVAPVFLRMSPGGWKCLNSFSGSG